MLQKNNNNDDLLTYLRKAVPKLSKSHRKIAFYLIENFDKADFSSAVRLGKAVGVSESTVVRFACELGFSGYPMLQRALDKLIRNNLTTVQRMEVASQKMEVSPNPVDMNHESVIKSVMEQDIGTIKKTLHEIDETAFYQSVSELLNAKKIYIIAGRSSSALAGYLGFYFNLIFDRVKLINSTSAGEMFEEILRVNENDAVILISFPRYSLKTIRAAKYAASQNAKIIAITDDKNAPINKYADYILIAGSQMASFVDSLVAPMSVVNALIVAVSLEKKEELGKTLDKLEKIWREYDVYANGEQ